MCHFVANYVSHVSAKYYLSGNKRNRFETLTRCAKLSPFAVFSFVNNLIYGRKLTALRNFSP